MYFSTSVLRYFGTRGTASPKMRLRKTQKGAARRKAQPKVLKGVAHVRGGEDSCERGWGLVWEGEKNSSEENRNKKRLSFRIRPWCMAHSPLILLSFSYYPSLILLLLSSYSPLILLSLSSYSSLLLLSFSSFIIISDFNSEYNHLWLSLGVLSESPRSPLRLPSEFPQSSFGVPSEFLKADHEIFPLRLRLWGFLSLLLFLLPRINLPRINLTRINLPKINLTRINLTITLFAEEAKTN